MAIKYTHGNLLDSNSKILVNPVNCVGVMGAGLAQKFKQKYPEYYNTYLDYCKSKNYKMWDCPYWSDFIITEPQIHIKTIVSFPTKAHWRNPSELNNIQRQLHSLVHEINRTGEWEQYSISFPKLGCGLGGLNWEDVKPVMEYYLNKLNAEEVLIYV